MLNEIKGKNIPQNLSSSSNNVKLLRVNSILDIPSSIECFSTNKEKTILAVGRGDNSIELWKTDSWVQILKITGNSSKK